MDAVLARRGFLPADDPAQALTTSPALSILDDLGAKLPEMLEDPGFRDHVRGLRIPSWPETSVRQATLPQLRLYYVRLGFLASAYVNQIGQPAVNSLPANIAVPLTHACALLERPPILSYDGYALYNWRRLDASGPIALGNIDTLQNFVKLYDEHWFILVHVEIEGLACRVLAAINEAAAALHRGDRDAVTRALLEIAASIWRQVAVLRRIPEHMDPALYYRRFRPYIRFFENVVYDGVTQAPMNFRGETGAQSSIMPTLVAFMKIPHRPSALTNHLADMRRFMPAQHRAVMTEVEAMPPVRGVSDPAAFNEVLEAMATFREVHYGWAREYIDRWVDDPRGTGGTPYMNWLKQLIDETRQHKVEA